MVEKYKSDCSQPHACPNPQDRGVKAFPVKHIQVGAKSVPHDPTCKGGKSGKSGKK
jgi:hypothetical protein